MTEGLIRYSTDKKTLQYVPALSTITIKSETTSIKGSSSETYAFYDARNTIETVHFENNPQLQYISPYCFYCCIKLSSIDISACTELTQIGQYSFYKCSSLKEISFPSIIAIIYSYAFAHSGLINITIPESFKGFAIH